MIIIPSGSDASIQHHPRATVILAGLCALLSVVVWLVWPRAAVEGPMYIVHADAIAAWERVEAAEQARAGSGPATAAGVDEPSEYSHLAYLRNSVGLGRAPAKPLSPMEKADIRSAIAYAVEESLIDGTERDRLLKALATVPEVTDTFRRLDLLTDEAGPIITEDAVEAQQLLAAGKSDGSLTAEQHARFTQRLAGRRVVSAGYLELSSEVDGPLATRPISLEERTHIQNRVVELVALGELKPDERAEFEARLAKRPVVSEQLAALEQCTVDEVPWFMIPFGGLAWPWSWITATFINCHWRDAVFNIGLLWSFGLVVEGKLGWRRFLPVLGLGVLGTGAITTAAGLLTGVVLPVCGSRDLVGFLAGICLIWTPTNDIHYRRWLGVTLGEFEIPVWVVLSFAAGVQLVLGYLGGFPPAANLLMALGCPLLGAVTATALLRRGVVETDGWDLYAWWRTRHLGASERNALERERRLAARKQADAPQAAAEADLLSAAVAEFATDLAAGNGQAALAIHQAIRQQRPSWRAAPAQLDRLMKLLWKAALRREAAQIAEELVAAEPATVDGRIILAVDAIDNRKPATAVRHLDALPPTLSPTQMQQRDALRAKAAALEASGEREVEFL